MPCTRTSAAPFVTIQRQRTFAAPPIFSTRTKWKPEHRIRFSAGWGTYLTNDFRNCNPRGDDGFNPVSLVCKLSEVDGRPAVKLSDNYSESHGAARRDRALSPDFWDRRSSQCSGRCLRNFTGAFLAKNGRIKRSQQGDGALKKFLIIAVAIICLVMGRPLIARSGHRHQWEMALRPGDPWGRPRGGC